MKIATFIIFMLIISLILAVIISKLLKGRVKKFTREELEEKIFGKNN